MRQDSSSESSNSSKLQLKVYAKVDAKPVARENAIPLVVSVTAPADVAERVPLDVVAVLHVDSRSRLPAYWRELLMNAMKLVIDRLGGNDRLAILPVHSTFQGMTTEGKREVSDALQLQEMRKDRPIGDALQAADKMIYAREDKLGREGVIILISNNYKDTTSENIRYKVHAFGIHGAHDAKDMWSLGMRTSGGYAVLNDDLGSITEAFTSSIHRLTSTIAVEASINFSPNTDHSAEALQYKAPWDDEELMELFSMHHRGATRNLVWYVEGLQENQYNDLPKLSAVDLSYCHRPGSKLVWGKTIHGQVLVVKKGDQASNEVAAEIVRSDTLNAVLEILVSVSRNSSWEELQGGADELRKQWRSVQDSDHGREAAVAGLTHELAMEMREMEARLRYNNSWQEYMCSWVAQQFLGLPLMPIHKGDSGSEVASLLLQRPRIFVRQLADTVSRPTAEQHQAIPVLVQVVAPPATAAMERAHVNLVAVLDVSYGAMKPTSKKMELLGKSIELVMNRLSDKDCLAIIPVQSSDTQPTTGLLEMSEQGRNAISAMLRSLSAAPAKNTAAQASHGRESLKKAVKKILTSKCFPVASGSQNTSETMTPSLGESGSTELWKALTDAVELLDGGRRQGIDRVGLIILISDGGDNRSIVHGTLGGGYTVHAFGFRDAHNAIALHRIASSSGGIYAVLNTEDGRVTKAFDVCIDKISSIVASQLQFDIRCSNWSGVTLSAIESGQLISGISHDKKLGYVMVGNLDHGAMRKFIICLDNNVYDDDDDDDDDDDEDEDKSFPGLFVTARVRYAVAGWMEMEQNQVYLQAPKDDPEASSDFAAAIVRAKAVEMVSKIAQKYGGGGDSVTMGDKRFQAAKELDAGWRRIKASQNAQAAGEAKLAGLARDIQEIKASLTMDTGLPLPHMLSWLSFQMICEQIPSEREVNPVEYSPGSHTSPAGLPPLWI